MESHDRSKKSFERKDRQPSAGKSSGRPARKPTGTSGERSYDRKPREGGSGERSYDRKPREGGSGRTGERSYDRKPREGGSGRTGERSYDRKPREGGAGERSYDRKPREAVRPGQVGVLTTDQVRDKLTVRSIAVGKSAKS